MKKLFLFLVLFVLTVSTAACSDNGQAAKNDSPAGVYTLIKSVSGGVEFKAAEAGMSGKLTLNEDGTGTIEAMGSTQEVTWDSEKKTIAANTVEDTYEYHDGVFEWKMEDVVQVFEKVEESSE
jgi:hypothetical protein